MLERNVKKEAKKIFKELAPHAYLFWPVQTGYGMSDLDLIASVNGFDLRVEFKNGLNKPTKRQRLVTDDLTYCGVPVLWINERNLDDLRSVIIYLNESAQLHAFEFAYQSRRKFDEEIVRRVRSASG